MTEEAPSASDDCEAHPSDAFVLKAQARLESAAGSSPPAAPQVEVVLAGVEEKASPGAIPAAGDDVPHSRKPKKSQKKRKRVANSADEAGAAPAKPGGSTAEHASLQGSRSPDESAPQHGDAVAVRDGASRDVATLQTAQGTAAAGNSNGLAAAAVRKPLPAPVGVVVVADDAETARAPEMQRLLRAPRCALR